MYKQFCHEHLICLLRPISRFLDMKKMCSCIHNQWLNSETRVESIIHSNTFLCLWKECACSIWTTLSISTFTYLDSVIRTISGVDSCLSYLFLSKSQSLQVSGAIERTVSFLNNHHLKLQPLRERCILHPSDKPMQNWRIYILSLHIQVFAKLSSLEWSDQHWASHAPKCKGKKKD